jgi:hypothetical protein
MLWTIEYVDEILPCYAEADAQRMLDWLKTNHGYLGGRLLAPITVGRGWRIQTFFRDTPEAEGSLPLPDGVHRRLTPTHMLDAASAWL